MATGERRRVGRASPAGELRAQQLIDLVIGGATLQEAGERFGITRQRVRQILKRDGLDVRALPGRRTVMARRRFEHVRERAPAIEAMWRQGMSYPQIADALSVSQLAAKRVIHERVPYEQRLERAARKHSNRSRMPDEWALEALREAARILGRTPSCRAYERLRASGQIDGPAQSLITARLGWSTACELAGLTPNRRVNGSCGARVYSEADLSAALQRVNQSLAHPPSVNEYDAHRRDDEPSAVTIRHRYGGSWLRARSQLLRQP